MTAVALVVIAGCPLIGKVTAVALLLSGVAGLVFGRD